MATNKEIKMAARKMVKTLETLITLGRQGVFYKELISYGEHKLRIDIESDSYDFQCKATISVLQKGDGAIKWERLDYIPHAAMATRSGLYYIPQAQKRRDCGNLPVSEFQSCFQVDRDRLLNNAKALLA